MQQRLIKTLLATTAVVAISAFAGQAVAQTVTVSADATNTATITGTAGTADVAGNPPTNNANDGSAGLVYDTNSGIDITKTTNGITGGAGAVGANHTGTGNGTAGGVGGAGVTFGGLATSTITLSGSVGVTGGDGAIGGNGGGGGNGGAGGSGGAGITANSAGGVITLGTGTISGGIGADAGTGGTPGAHGVGGAGVAVSENTTINFSGAGTIRGGAAGTGADGAGIAFSGAAKTLSITGSTGTIAGGDSGAGIAFNSTATGASTVANAAIIGGSAHTGNAFNIASGALSSLTNTGTIQSSTGIALNIVGDLGTLTNTSGTITSANVTSTAGTVVFGSDLTNGIALNGTISNTANNANANTIYIGAQQTAAITSSATISAASSTRTAVRFADGITSATFSQTGGTITGAIAGGNNADTFHYNNSTSATGLTGAIDLAAGTNILDIDQDFTTGGTVAATGGTVAVDVATTKLFTAAHAVTTGAATTLAAGASATDQTELQINSGVAYTTATDSVAANARYRIQVTSANNSATSTQTKAAAAAGHGQLVLSTGVESTINVASDIFVVGSGAAGALVHGSQFVAIDGGAAESDLTADAAVADDSYAFNFLYRVGGGGTTTALSNDDANDVVLEVARVAGTTASNTNVRAIDSTLNSIAATGDTNFDSFQGRTVAAASEAAYQNVVESVLADEVGVATHDAAITVVDSTFGLAANRLGSIRGAAAGAETLPNRVWVQGYGRTATQDRRDSIDGYDADSYGVALGADGKFDNDQATLGVAFTYGVTESESDDANRSETDIDSYQLSVYGDYNLTDGFFIEGMAAYALNEIDSTRKDVGVVGQNATADFDANSYAARVAVGNDVPVDSSTRFTPKVFAQYALVDADSYTETGAGSANLTVDTDSSSELNLGVELELASDFRLDDGSLLTPAINVGYMYDVIADEVEASNTFAAGGGAFTTRGAEPEESTFTAGLALDYYSTDAFQLTASYDFEYKEDYDSHAATLRAGYRF